MLVVPPPGQVCCCKQRPVQDGELPQTLGVPAPPQSSPGPQIGGAGAAGQQSTTPPQPSAMKPQFAAPHVFFTHGGAPHRLGVPPPPHVSPTTHETGQLMTLPQPSAIGPQSPGAHVVLVGTQT